MSCYYCGNNYHRPKFCPKKTDGRTHLQVAEKTALCKMTPSFINPLRLSIFADQVTCIRCKDRIERDSKGGTSGTDAKKNADSSGQPGGDEEATQAVHF